MKHPHLKVRLPAGIALFVDPPVLVERVDDTGHGMYRLAFETELGFEVHNVAEAKKLASELARVTDELDTLWLKAEAKR